MANEARKARVKRYLNSIAKEEAKRLEAAIISAHRLNRDDILAQAVQELDDTGYYKEMGYRTMSRAMVAILGSKLAARRAVALSIAWRMRGVLPDLWDWYKAGMFQIRKLYYIRKVISPSNAPNWLPLLIFLNQHELRMAAQEYARNSGRRGIFIPMWLPHDFFIDVWQKADRGLAYDTLVGLLENRT